MGSGPNVHIFRGDPAGGDLSGSYPDPSVVGGTGGGGGGTDTYSRVNVGTTDGTALSISPLFFNSAQQSLKIYIGGNWITLVTVSYDSLWDSVTDFWDSNTMDWDSPN